MPDQTFCMQCWSLIIFGGSEMSIDDFDAPQWRKVRLGARGEKRSWEEDWSQQPASSTCSSFVVASPNRTYHDFRVLKSADGSF